MGGPLLGAIEGAEFAKRVYRLYVEEGLMGGATMTSAGETEEGSPRESASG